MAHLRTPLAGGLRHREGRIGPPLLTERPVFRAFCRLEVVALEATGSYLPVKLAPSEGAAVLNSLANRVVHKGENISRDEEFGSMSAAESLFDYVAEAWTRGVA